MRKIDRVIEVKVNGTFVSKDNVSAGSQGEANATALRIEFDEGWDGFAKTITWWDAKGETATSRVLTADLLEDIVASGRVYLTMIPSEALTVWGKCTFSIDGYTNGKRLRSAYSQLVVKPNGDGNDVAIESVTPTQAEQLQVQIDTLLGDMQEQAIIAHNAAVNAKASEEAAAQSAAEAATEARNADLYATKAEERAEAALIFANASETSAIDARVSATAAETSANHAASSQIAAAASASVAATSAGNALTSEKNASASATAAASSEQASALNQAYAQSHEESAALHDRNAQSYATDARASREAAQAAEANAKAAQAAAEKARNEASSIVGGNFATEEYVDNAVANASADIDCGTF